MTDLGTDDHDRLPPLALVLDDEAPAPALDPAGPALAPPELPAVSDEALADVGADQQRRHALRAFGTQVRIARRSAGFKTRADLAAAVRHPDVDAIAIAGWERGHCVPDGELMAVVADALGDVPALVLSWRAVTPSDAAVTDVGPDGPSPEAQRIAELEARVAELERIVAALATGPDRRDHVPARGWASRARNLTSTGR